MGKRCNITSIIYSGKKALLENWKCVFNHEYDKCKCHLELREYGQDESIYYSSETPKSRWGINNRSYSISKSKGVSRMV